MTIKSLIYLFTLAQVCLGYNKDNVLVDYYDKILIAKSTEPDT